MRFSKLVSGISSLAIAASAFAGIAVTANAEDSTTLYEFGNSTDTAWTETEMANWTTSNATLALNTDSTVNSGYGRIYYTATKPSTAMSATRTFNVTEDALVTYDVDWYYANSTGRESNYEYLQLGSAIRLGYNSKYYVYVSTDGGTKYGDAISAYNNSGGPTNVQVTVDTSTNIIKSFKFGDTEITKYENISLASGTTYGSVSFGLQRGGSTSNWAYLNGIEGIKISEVKQTVETAKYTLNYYLGSVADANLLSTSTPEYVVGQTPDIDKGEITINNANYFWVSDDRSAVADDDSTVINVIVRKPYTYTATLTSSADQSVVASQSDVEEGTSVTLYYPRYILSGTSVYMAKTTDGTNSTGYGITLSYDNKTKEITYSEDYYTDIVYFSEGEDISGFSTYSDTPRMSKGAGGTATSDTKVTSLSAGKYKLIVGYRAQNDSYTYTFKAGDSTITFDSGETTALQGHGYWLESTSDEFTLTDTTDITAACSAAKAGIDYILIQKTGDVETTTTHSEAYTFNTLASNLNGKTLKVMFKNAKGTVGTADGQYYTEKLDSTTFTGESEAALAVVVTDIADGYSVASVTIE